MYYLKNFGSGNSWKGNRFLGTFLWIFLASLLINDASGLNMSCVIPNELFSLNRRDAGQHFLQNWPRKHFNGIHLHTKMFFKSCLKCFKKSTVVTEHIYYWAYILLAPQVRNFEKVWAYILLTIYIIPRRRRENFK